MGWVCRTRWRIPACGRSITCTGQKSSPENKPRRKKRRLRREWEKAVSLFAAEDKLCRYHSRLLRDTEAAKTACRKYPTPENAMRLCNVLDGLEVM